MGWVSGIVVENKASGDWKSWQHKTKETEMTKYEGEGCSQG